MTGARKQEPFLSGLLRAKIFDGTLFFKQLMFLKLFVTVLWENSIYLYNALLEVEIFKLHFVLVVHNSKFYSGIALSTM